MLLHFQGPSGKNTLGLKEFLNDHESKALTLQGFNNLGKPCVIPIETHPTDTVIAAGYHRRRSAAHGEVWIGGRSSPSPECWDLRCSKRILFAIAMDD